MKRLLHFCLCWCLCVMLPVAAMASETMLSFPADQIPAKLQALTQPGETLLFGLRHEQGGGSWQLWYDLGNNVRRLREMPTWLEDPHGYVYESNPIPPLDGQPATLCGGNSGYISLTYDDGVHTFSFWDGQLWEVQGPAHFKLHEDGLLGLKPNGAWDRMYYGAWAALPNLNALDPTQLPTTFEQAMAFYDASNYRVVQNPNPDDRLNLRTKPDRHAPSKGRYYNGTPVEVLSIEGEWAHVRLFAHTTGYMMTQYLAPGVPFVPQEAGFPELRVRPDYLNTNLEARYVPNQHWNSAPIATRAEEGTVVGYVVGDAGNGWLHAFLISGGQGFMKAKWFAEVER